MLLKKLISNYTAYNHWANGKLTDWLKTLNGNLVYSETASSYANIDLTIQHMLHAQNFWLAVLDGQDYKNIDETVKNNSFDSNVVSLMKGSQRMIDIFNEYTEEELQEQVSTDVTTQSRYDFILHIVNHNSYHRGQIITICRQQGVIKNIPCTDYEYFLWERK